MHRRVAGAGELHEQATKIPKVGTSAYTTTIVQPVVAYLVTQAQVQNIAKALHVSVTPKQLKAQVNQAITQYYGGNQAKYQADLKKYDLTEADVEQQFKLTLLEQNIETKLKGQVKVTTKDLHDYYNSHKSLYETTAVHAEGGLRARADQGAGRQGADGSQGRQGLRGRHEGRDRRQRAARARSSPRRARSTRPSSRRRSASRPTSSRASWRSTRQYAGTSLKGKCKPTCYFIIRPTADVIKGGAKKSFGEVEAQIQTALLSSRQTAHLQAVVTRLENAQKKITHYAPGYKPPKTPKTPSTGVPDTGEATNPAT